MKIDLSGHVELAHGSGGRASQTLIEGLFLKHFHNKWLDPLSDQASIQLSHPRIAMATDSHVIKPLFFPGGNIGSLSVYGTVNDVSLSGATPQYLSVGFILEEGFPLGQLDIIVQSMAQAARRCQVAIVTGDTKVVEKGMADGVYINTTGIGVYEEGSDMGTHQIQPGDHILINGDVGDHGAAILAARNEGAFQSALKSDCQGLNDLIETMKQAAPNLRMMRDPTRGGLSSCLNEIAQQAGFSLSLMEEQIPIGKDVRAITEILGLDPLTLANEGKLIAFCPAEESEGLLARMRTHPKGQGAKIIGEVLKDANGYVSLTTSLGGQRLIDWQWADALPRIC